MKVLLLTLSVIGCAIAEAPYPASGTKPEGALLLLPPEYNQPSNQGSSSQYRNEAEDLSTVSDKVMERLKQEQGSGSGTYHVYLADGRLQKVQFTTAPVKSEQQNTESQQKSGFQAFAGSQQVEQFSSQTNKQQSGQFSEKQQNAPAFSQQYSQQQYSQKQQNYPVYSQPQTEEISSLQQYSQKQQKYPVYSQPQTEEFSSQYFQKQQSAPSYNQQQTGESSSQYSQQQYFQKQQSAPTYSQQYNQQLTGESSSQQETAKFSSQYKESSQNTELNPIIAQFGKLQQEFQQKQIQQLQQKQQELELQQQELKQQQEELKSASYVASLRYTNVDPITSPIYSYKPSPVTRILRYAPQYY